MRRAVVIRYGDPDTANAIADGMARALDDGELEIVKAENRRLNALNGVRSYGDSVRLETACKALAVKYSTKPTKPVLAAILGAWALLWCAIFAAFAYLQEWNRA